MSVSESTPQVVLGITIFRVSTNPTKQISRRFPDNFHVDTLIFSMLAASQIRLGITTKEVTYLSQGLPGAAHMSQQQLSSS